MFRLFVKIDLFRATAFTFVEFIDLNLMDEWKRERISEWGNLRLCPLINKKSIKVKAVVLLIYLFQIDNPFTLCYNKITRQD